MPASAAALPAGTLGGGEVRRGRTAGWGPGWQEPEAQDDQGQSQQQQLATRRRGLPTLLHIGGSSPSCKGRPASPAVERPDDDDPYEPCAYVKNTFIHIHTAAQRSPSLEPFYQERAVETCPAKFVGCLAQGAAFEDRCGSGSQTHSTTAEPSFPSSSTSTPQGGLCQSFGVQTPTDEGSPQAASLAGWNYAYLVSPAGASPLRGGDASMQILATQAMMETSCISAAGALSPSAALDGSLVMAPVMPLEEAALGPGALGPAAPQWLELPSVGSALHAKQRCKPCAFLHTKGCQIGWECKFCHLCAPGERTRRRKGKKEKMQTRRAAQKARLAATEGAQAWPGGGAAGGDGSSPSDSEDEV